LVIHVTTPTAMTIVGEMKIVLVLLLSAIMLGGWLPSWVVEWVSLVCRAAQLRLAWTDCACSWAQAQLQLRLPMPHHGHAFACPGDVTRKLHAAGPRRGP
jgi:hypothetical protein